MKPIRFGIIGGGWRSLFFLRIAQAMPEQFEVAGMFVRNPTKAQELAATWSVKTYATLDELLKINDLRFVVVRPCAPFFGRQLAPRLDRCSVLALGQHDALLGHSACRIDAVVGIVDWYCPADGLDAAELAVGDLILVGPGERFPTDGRVVEGTSDVDQSPATGEA